MVRVAACLLICDQLYHNHQARQQWLSLLKLYSTAGLLYQGLPAFASPAENKGLKIKHSFSDQNKQISWLPDASQHSKKSICAPVHLAAACQRSERVTVGRLPSCSAKKIQQSRTWLQRQVEGSAQLSCCSWTPEALLSVMPPRMQCRLAVQSRRRTALWSGGV